MLYQLSHYRIISIAKVSVFCEPTKYFHRKVKGNGEKTKSWWGEGKIGNHSEQKHPRPLGGEGAGSDALRLVGAEHANLGIETLNDVIQIRMAAWHDDSDEILHAFVNEHFALKV